MHGHDSKDLQHVRIVHNILHLAFVHCHFHNSPHGTNTAGNPSAGTKDTAGAPTPRTDDM